MLSNLISGTTHAVGAVLRRVGLQCATAYHHATLAQVGGGTRFHPRVRLHPARNVVFGRDCYVWRGTCAATEHPQGTLRVGDRVEINRDVHLDMTGGLVIGDDVLISEGVVIYTHDHGLDPRAQPSLCPKVIGPDVWIGMRAVILPNCRNIGAGALIGAGAIVTRDVPAHAIVAGNPARQIGQKPQMQVMA
ncbi:MAG: acyltransferase [Yoonia sp.]|uniref:acyltransferase n=1 Tax=Yoonia sp. TaxID=2212373 RepID=UPI003EF8EA03